MKNNMFENINVVIGITGGIAATHGGKRIECRSGGTKAAYQR